MTDVANAYEAFRIGDQVMQLYLSGYLQQAQDSRDISEYAYKRGAASLLDFLDAERSYRATQLAYRPAFTPPTCWPSNRSPKSLERGNCNETYKRRPDRAGNCPPWITIGEEWSEQVGADLEKRAVYATSARELHFPDGVCKIE